MKNKNNTIADLRRNGYKVKVTHYRFAEDETGVSNTMLPSHDIREKRFSFYPKGGRTEVKITTPTGEDYFAQSLCEMN